MSAYLARVKKLQSEFEEFSIEQLPKRKNSDVNTLANLRSSISSEYRRTIPMEILDHPNIMDSKDIYSMEKIDQTWMDLIMSYIQNGALPFNKLKARKVQGVASKYSILNGQLYKQSYEFQKRYMTATKETTLEEDRWHTRLEPRGFTGRQ